MHEIPNCVCFEWIACYCPILAFHLFWNYFNCFVLYQLHLDVCKLSLVIYFVWVYRVFSSKNYNLEVSPSGHLSPTYPTETSGTIETKWLVLHDKKVYHVFVVNILPLLKSRRSSFVSKCAVCPWFRARTPLRRFLQMKLQPR